jgi:hypothetical protein
MIGRMMTTWITEPRLGAYAVAISVWLGCGIAYGQQSTPQARELFKQARALAADGNYSEACPIFEKSQALESGIGTQFNLADCWEHLGRTASAYRLFLSVAESASANGETERAKVATERAVALASKLSRLQIRQEHIHDEVRVLHHDEPLEQTNWSQPTAVDPGTYRVELASNGKVKWQTEVNVPARSLTVLVTAPEQAGSSTKALPAGAPDRNPESTDDEGQSAPVGAPSRVRPKHLPQRPAPVPPPEKRSSIWAPIAMVAGIGGIGAGTLFGLTYLSKNNQAKDICPNNVGCSDSDVARHASLVESAKTARLGAYLGFGLGTASIAAATIYYATRHPDRDYRPPVSVSVSPGIEPDRRLSWGIAAQGNF